MQKRTDRAAAQGTPDPFDTPSPTKPIRPFGDKPVASGIQEPEVPKPKKSGIELTRPTADLIPKSFSDFSKKIRDLKVDRDIDRRISGEIKPTAPIQQSFPGMDRGSSDTKSRRGRPRGSKNRPKEDSPFVQQTLDFDKKPEVPPVQGPKDAPVQGPRERGGEIIKRQPDSTAIIDQRPKRKQKSGEEIVRSLPRKNTLPSLRTVDATRIQNIKATAKIATQRYSQFARNNPALGLATYDLGKGIIGKIMKARIPPVRGGRAGTRTAGSFTAS